LVVLTVLIPLLNPVQVSYLLWEFQLWWYWVLLFLIMTTVLLEKFVLRAYPLIFLLCVCATFCGVPGLFLWLSTGTHFLLLSWQGDSHCSITIRTGAKIALLHLGIFLLNAWFLVAGVPPSSASSVPAGGLVSAAIGSIVYFCQLLGSPFGRRDIAIAFTAGTVSLVIWLVCVFRIVFQLRLHDLAVRIGLLLTSTALLWALAFAYGRQKHGIQWALWTFHASPMLLPFFVGLGTLAVRLLTSETSYAILTTAALGTLVAFLPSLTAMPFGQVRSAEMLRIASTAHVVSCNPGDYSMYLQLRLNGLEAHRDLYELSAPLARESCVREVNQDAAQELLVPPKEYAHLLTKDAPTHAALQTLWEVYMTRIDLQRAFPPSSPILTQKLLEFAYCNAKAGSNYEREQLAVHAQIYLEIGSHDAYGGRC
jgi:hypothetical protein